MQRGYVQRCRCRVATLGPHTQYGVPLTRVEPGSLYSEPAVGQGCLPLHPLAIRVVVKTSMPGCASSQENEPCCAEQPLQTPWTLWFDRVTPGTAYASTLQRLGTVHTVQGFWRYYCNLARPAQLQPGDNYHLFRGALQPAQETLPGGGCWLYRLRHATDQPLGDTEVNRLWETLLLTIVGESLGESCIAGAGVSVRAKEVVLTTWCRADEDAQATSRVGTGLQVRDGRTSTQTCAFQPVSVHATYCRGMCSLLTQAVFGPNAKLQWRETQVQPRQPPALAPTSPAGGANAASVSTPSCTSSTTS